MPSGHRARGRVAGDAILRSSPQFCLRPWRYLLQGRCNVVKQTLERHWLDESSIGERCEASVPAMERIGCARDNDHRNFACRRIAAETLKDFQPSIGVALHRKVEGYQVGLLLPKHFAGSLSFAPQDSLISIVGEEHVHQFEDDRVIVDHSNAWLHHHFVPAATNLRLFSRHQWLMPL